MGWYEALKDAVTVADKLRDAELNLKLAQVQVECAKLAQDNAHLRQELMELREQAQTRNEMLYKDNVYWRFLTEGKREGPFCPRCFDGQHKAARMSERTDDHYWRCSVCQLPIEKPGVRRQIQVNTDYNPFCR